MKDSIKLQNKIRENFKEGFEAFTEPDFDQNLFLQIKDLINHFEVQWDTFSIRYDTVMTKKEWEDFSTHPERIFYKSKLKSLRDANNKVVFDYIVRFLKEVYAYYKNLENSEHKEQLRKSINSLVECSFNAAFEDEELEEADLYVGRSKKDRENGNIVVSELRISKLKRAILEYYDYNIKLAEDSYQKLLNACGGDLLKITEYTSTCVLEKDFHKMLVEVSRIQARDLTLTFSDLKRGYRVWKIFREIGIDVNSYLDLLGLPDYDTVKRRLLDFMANKEFADEMIKHLEDELPECYSDYIKNGFVLIEDIMYERAKRKKYPTSLRSDKEINDMVERVKQEIERYFPISKNESPRNILLNPTHPAATSRAFNSTIKNINEQSVNTIVMTPRTDHLDDYLRTFAHETTHAIHRLILDLGEQSGVLKKGAADSIPGPVLEEFSHLIDQEFSSDKDLPYQKKYTGSEFPNFWSGYVTRFQVPYSLCQLTIRKEFDELFDSGFNADLPEKYMWDLKAKMDVLANDWYSLGVKIVHNGLSGLSLFTSYDPRDGVIYMKRYMMKENKDNKKVEDASIETDSQSKELNMTDAFRKRWGKKWIEETDARIMVHWLLLESGRNQNTHEFYKFIQEKQIEECLEELEKIGLTKDKII